MKNRTAFSLIEMLVATTIFILIVGLLLSLVSQTGSLWNKASAKIDAFQSARSAFDEITRKLSNATLSPRWEYDNPNAPTRYLKTSDLAFRCGRASDIVTVPTSPGSIPGKYHAVFFVLPEGYSKDSSIIGLNSMLNTVGFFVEWGSDANEKPSIVKSDPRWRSRLIEVVQPTELNESFQRLPGESSSLFAARLTTGGWIRDAVNQSNKRILGVNIIALILQPMSSSGISLDYEYNSTSQSSTTPQPPTANELPLLMRITMVAIDESSALKLASGSEFPAALTSALQGKFSDAQSFDADLASLNSTLANVTPAINFRVFSTTIRLKEAL